MSFSPKHGPGPPLHPSASLSYTEEKTSESAPVPHGQPGARSTAAGRAEAGQPPAGGAGRGGRRAARRSRAEGTPPSNGGRTALRSGPAAARLAPGRGPRPLRTAPARESGRPAKGPGCGTGLRRRSSRSPRHPARGLPASRRLRPGRPAAPPAPPARSRARPPALAQPLTLARRRRGHAVLSRAPRPPPGARPGGWPSGGGGEARADAVRPPHACGGGKGRRWGPPLPGAARPLTEPGRSSARRPARLRSSAPRREDAAPRGEAVRGGAPSGARGEGGERGGAAAVALRGRGARARRGGREGSDAARERRWDRGPCGNEAPLRYRGAVLGSSRSALRSSARRLRAVLPGCVSVCVCLPGGCGWRRPRGIQPDLGPGSGETFGAFRQNRDVH